MRFRFFGFKNRSLTLENNTVAITDVIDGEPYSSSAEIPAVVSATAGAVVGATVAAALTSAGAPVVVAAGCAAATNSLVRVDGYTKQNGTEVAAHNRTWPDCTEINNFS